MLFGHVRPGNVMPALHTDVSLDSWAHVTCLEGMHKMSCKKLQGKSAHG